MIVIQCAAGKRDGAGHLKTASGTPVVFVADPESAPAESSRHFARPDDASDVGKSWRTTLVEYNQRAGANPLGLLPAYRLYKDKAYERLVARFGVESVYILSAGWGLIKAAFLTPYYDITFSPSAEKYKRRRSSDVYRDFCMLPSSADGPVVFFGGKDYLPLFCSLTGAVKGRRTVFYNSAHVPTAPHCELRRFETTRRTNWHYDCVDAFINGRIRAE